MTSDLWNDAKRLSGLLGRLLSVTGCSGQQTYKGVLISADPVSKSLVLVKKSTLKDININEASNSDLNTKPKTKVGYELQIVPWVQQENIVIHEESLEGLLPNSSEIDSTLFRLQFLRCLTNNNRSLFNNNSKDLLERKNIVKSYLETHQLSVTESKNQTLLIQDLVTLNSPYTSFDCEGTNEIVLDRIRNLINQLDPK